MEIFSPIPNQSADSERRRQALMLFVQAFGEHVDVEQVPNEFFSCRGIQVNPDVWLVVSDGFPDLDVIPVHRVVRRPLF